MLLVRLWEALDKKVLQKIKTPYSFKGNFSEEGVKFEKFIAHQHSGHQQNYRPHFVKKQHGCSNK